MCPVKMCECLYCADVKRKRSRNKDSKHLKCEQFMSRQYRSSAIFRNIEKFNSQCKCQCVAVVIAFLCDKWNSTSYVSAKSGRKSTGDSYTQTDPIELCIVCDNKQFLKCICDKCEKFSVTCGSFWAEWWLEGYESWNLFVLLALWFENAGLHWLNSLRSWFLRFLSLSFWSSWKVAFCWICHLWHLNNMTNLLISFSIQLQSTAND